MSRGVFDHWKIRGIKRSEEFKNKISSTLKGRHISPNTEFKKGIPLRKGIPHSEETKRRMSESRLGRPISQNTRLKMGLAHKKRWSDPIYKEKQLERLFKTLNMRPTGLEKTLIRVIEKWDLPYKYVGDGSFLIGYKNPDFINTNSEKICLEIGDKVEKDVKRKYRDYQSWQEYERQRIEHFAKYGWRCIVFWSDEFFLDKYYKKEKPDWETTTLEKLGGK